jgi:multidrug efflux system membrane fusion protein
LLFSDVTVDPGTGNAVVRVLVENPGNRLLPGMFVRARLPCLRMPHAITVPQQAVAHDAAGRAVINVWNGRGIEERQVEAGDVVDGSIIVLKGIKAGEKVVVVGMDRVLPGAPVKALPWQAPVTR